MTRPPLSPVLPALFVAGAALLTAGAVRVRGAVEATRIPLPNGRLISPLGEHTGVGSFPANMIRTPDGRFLIVTDTGYRQALTVLRAADGKIVSQIDFNGLRKSGSGKQGLYYGLALAPAAGGGTLYVSRGAEDRISIFELSSDGRLTDTGREILDAPSGAGAKPFFTAGLALSGDGRQLYAVHNETYNNGENIGSMSVLETATGRRTALIPLPGFPLAVAAVTRGRDANRKVYVTSERDRAVSAVDLQAGHVVANLDTGDHPLALLLDGDQKRLYVTNAGSDTVTVIDTRTDRITGTVLIRPEDVRGLPGATPTGLALSPDGRRLYVTLGDMNAVAVVETAGLKVMGYLPTGWYPTAVAVSDNGRRLFVTSAKGVRERHPNDVAQGPGGKWGRYIQDLIEGTCSVIELPDRDELRRLSNQVMANNFIGTGRRKLDEVRLENPGIQHVIYIVKENRTYDQVFGDLPGGNGDPNQCLFPREVTPNLHALAERFVLLDNFYCSAEVSGDGWNYSTSGMANEYVVRNVPYSYSGRGRVYDYEGQNNGVDAETGGFRDVAAASGGYIWDNVTRNHLSMRNYGFFSHQANPNPLGGSALPPDSRSRPDKFPLVGHTDEDFLQFNLSYADSDAWVRHGQAAPLQKKEAGRFHAPSRFAEWKREWDGYVKSGDLPRFMMVRFGRDHTNGTAAGHHSPRAMVADNDYAVGELVEAVSRSPFWKSTAIFILEDDAQGGQDHVDAHRSPCLVISPYIRQATVDHRFYNTDSVLHSMELLLGLPPMCQFDATAPVMRVFGAAAENDAPYRAILPERRVVTEVNGARAYGAALSARLDFSDADRVPDAVLNDILWHSIRGEHTPLPPRRNGLQLRAEQDRD